MKAPKFSETEGGNLAEAGHFDGRLFVDSEIGSGIGGMPKGFKRGFGIYRHVGRYRTWPPDPNFEVDSPPTV
jgi:hypothetical protein